MKFELTREALLAPLSRIAGVVEKRQTLPVLGNVLLQVDGTDLHLAATDMEVEIRSQCALEGGEDGALTVPARKFLDIVRALSDGSLVRVQAQESKVQIIAGRSRFTLSTLPATDFPSVEEMTDAEEIRIPEASLRFVIERTAFAMAQQDVRYFLNGLLLQANESRLRAVATDGHRLAIADQPLADNSVPLQGAIIPRKGVLELAKLLKDEEEEIGLSFSRNHVRLRKGADVLTSKLIEGRYPDYEAVIPLGIDKRVLIDRLEFRQALQRTAILTNEKYRGVRLALSQGTLQMVAHNPEQEEALEELSVDYDGPEIRVGFNVSYVLDALAALDGTEIELGLRDPDSSCLIKEPDSDAARHVVMPLKL